MSQGVVWERVHLDHHRVNLRQSKEKKGQTKKKKILMYDSPFFFVYKKVADFECLVNSSTMA